MSTCKSGANNLAVLLFAKDEYAKDRTAIVGIEPSKESNLIFCWLACMVL